MRDEIIANREDSHGRHGWRFFKLRGDVEVEIRSVGRCERNKLGIREGFQIEGIVR